MSINFKGFSDPQTQQEMYRANPANFGPRIPRLRKPDRFIYIYSVAKRTFPKTSSQYFKQPFKGCTDGERYVLCGAIPDPPYLIETDETKGGNRIFDEDSGTRVAVDLLNPNNPTNDPYWENSGALGAYFGTSANSNLVAQGLFPSFNNPPTEEELVKAEETRDGRYQKLVNEAMRLEGFSQKDLQEFIRDNPDVHPAMDALGLEAPWHKRHEIKQNCPNCGTQVKAGIAFHMFEGGLCVLDWKKAVSAGRVKREDVPEEMQWWGDEPRRGPGRPPKVAA